MKIVRNIGAGFAISMTAARFMADRGSERAAEDLKRYPDEDDWNGFGYLSDGSSYDRTDPLLVLAVETLGSNANYEGSCLEIVDVPDDVNWYIYEDEGGYETIHEKHRRW